MAKIKVPATEIEVCDCCGSRVYLNTCKACGGQYCNFCKGTVPGCMVPMDVCRKCGERQEVKDAAYRFSSQLRKTMDDRDKELRALQPVKEDI